MKLLLISLVSVLLMICMTGCVTIRNGNKAENPFPAQEIFKKKTVAILPVKSQTSLTTDSQNPLKKALNKKIQNATQTRFSGAKVVGIQASLEALNNAGKLDVLEKLITSYDNTGAFDKILLSSLCSTLKADFILLSKLKIEQSDLVIAKNFWSSLEILLLRKDRSEPIWSGIGDFKRSGIYGAGGTETEEAATELVTLALGQSISNSQTSNEATINKTTSEDQTKPIQDIPVDTPVAAPSEQPVVQSVEKSPASSVTHKNTPPPSVTMVVSSPNTKLRKTPSKKAAVVKSMKKGDEVTVVKQKDDWLMVELAGGEVGWCHKSSFER